MRAHEPDGTTTGAASPNTRKPWRATWRAAGQSPLLNAGCAAARLVLGEGHLAAEMLQHLDGRARHVVEERVAQAGRHQLNVASGLREHLLTRSNHALLGHRAARVPK